MMIYESWMSYIKDETKITELVIPGAHNAGSYGMRKLAECQKGNIFKQFQYGMRQFCLRLSEKKDGAIFLAHGINKGDLFENALKDIKKILDEYPSEILLLDIREYQPQKFGPITLKYKADVNKVNALLEKYLKPQENAYYDFENISEVTLGDIRKAGKRFIIINEAQSYKFSKNCRQILPWDIKVNGMKAENFRIHATDFFDTCHTDGFYWFQTQQTPNLGTEIGVTSPKELDESLRPYFGEIIEKIANTESYLKQANIIAGDFMTEDYMKSELILSLNILKNNVKEDLVNEYREGLKWN